MIKVLPAEQMREVDRLTTERYGIPSLMLMENAAHAVAQVVTDKLRGSVKGKEILILCGKGNNGGDGAAIARLLWKEGAAVFPILFGQVSEASGDARVNFDVLKRLDENVATSGNEFNKLILHEDDEDLVPLVEGILSAGPDMVIDAIFGTGLVRELGGVHARVIQSLEDHAPPIISVDIPSGLSSDHGHSIGPHLTAKTTVTFTAPKPGNVVTPAASSNGELIIANIGSPEQLISEQPSDLYLAEAGDVNKWLKQSEFKSASYKNKRGHLLVIAGSSNYTGAAVLCGDAAIRSGVGLVTIAAPEPSLESIVARVSPEVMVRGIAATQQGSAAAKAIEDVNGFLKNVDAIAVGSGLSSKEEETRSLVRRLVEERMKPVLIDADGLTALSPWATTGGTKYPLILTPHEGEFRRLLGVGKDEIQEILKDRVRAVRDFATKHNVFLVLKGERNLIGGPDGRVVVIPNGNPGLGKAGNGDTLTGVIGGFVAQAAAMKIGIFETLVAASYVAAMAGDMAEKKFGKRVMTASDVRDCLVEVFAAFDAGA